MQVMQDTDGRIDVMGRIAYGLEAQAGGSDEFAFHAIIHVRVHK